MLLSIGLEYVNAVFQTIKDSDFASYTIIGMKALAVLFFLVNILKKYYEGGASDQGLTWGLTPTELIKNFAVVLVVIFYTEVLDAFDSILVAIEGQYRGTAPTLLPLGIQEIEVEEDLGLLDATTKAMGLLTNGSLRLSWVSACWPGGSVYCYGCSTCSSIRSFWPNAIFCWASCRPFSPWSSAWRCSKGSGRWATGSLSYMPRSI